MWGFLAYVVADDNGKVSLGDIHVVGEFPNVFLEDLYGLPSYQKIEFSVVWLPTAHLFSKAPYQMALIERKELKV